MVLIFGGFVVIAHNVYHLVPNEVPILFVAALISFHLRDGGLRSIGFRKPASWSITIAIALAAAAVRILLGQFVVDPITAHFWPPAASPFRPETIAGNWKEAAQWLGIVWTFAAFGEEFSYRGYLLTRAADLGKRSSSAYWLAALLASVLFGYGHYYKGPPGMIDSGMAGLVLAAAYLLSGRNLWVCILAHGFIDTFSVVAVFLGWAS